MGRRVSSLLYKGLRDDRVYLSMYRFWCCRERKWEVVNQTIETVVVSIGFLAILSLTGSSLSLVAPVSHKKSYLAKYGNVIR